MNLRGRLSLGGVLIWRSLQVVAVNPQLVVYPTLSWLAFVGSVGALGAVFTGRSFLPALVAPGTQLAYWLGVTDVVAALAGGAVLTTLFNVALVNNTIRRLRDEDPRVRDGLYAGLVAWDRVLLWGFVSSTVGPIAHAIERIDRTGTLIDVVFGDPWSTATFFVSPIVAFEDVRVSRLFERGRQLYRKTWGYTAGASLGVDLVLGLVAVPLVVVWAYAQTASLAAVSADLLSAVAVVGLSLVVLVRQIAVGVSKAALYIHATTGRTPKAYTGIDFSEVAWRPGASAE